jgi:hypothetical protein
MPATGCPLVLRTGRASLCRDGLGGDGLCPQSGDADPGLSALVYGVPAPWQVTVAPSRALISGAGRPTRRCIADYSRVSEMARLGLTSVAAKTSGCLLLLPRKGIGEASLLSEADPQTGHDDCRCGLRPDQRQVELTTSPSAASKDRSGLMNRPDDSRRGMVRARPAPWPRRHRRSTRPACRRAGSATRACGRRPARSV